MPDVNPYASPKSSDHSGLQKNIVSNERDRCPLCNALVNPWKIGNSIRRHRCSGCNEPLWMECSTIVSIFCMALPLILIGIWYLVLPADTLVSGCTLIGIGIPIVNVFARILLGHPVGKHTRLLETQNASLGRNEISTKSD